MNKLLILLLAICLVNVHAFVRRDAPTSENILEKAKKDLTEMGEKIKESFKPEEIKKNFNEFVDNVQKTFGGDTNAPKQ